MSDGSPERKAITPDLYRRIMDGLELNNIYLLSSSATIDRENIGTDVGIKLSGEASFAKIPKGDIEVTQEYLIEARNRALKKKYLNIKCKFCFVYSSKLEFTEEFFETFKKANLPINTWPYFREFVYNITSRMYIPPLTLPLLKR